MLINNRKIKPIKSIDKDKFSEKTTKEPVIIKNAKYHDSWNITSINDIKEKFKVNEIPVNVSNDEKVLNVLTGKTETISVSQYFDYMFSDEDKTIKYCKQLKGAFK